MKRSVADFAGACAMIFASSAAFLVMGLIPMTLPWYHPLERYWALEVRPHSLAMDFYGRTLYAMTAGGLAFFMGRTLGARVERPRRDQLLLWLAWALAFSALAMTLFGYQLWPRPPQPLAIPAWYQPK